MRSTQHLRSAHRATVAYCVLLLLAVLSVGVHFARQAAHFATSAPACARAPAAEAAHAPFGALSNCWSGRNLG